MKIVRDDAARWLPSRHRFALARLVAYFVSLRVAHRRRREHVMLVIDRNQSQAENYTLSLLYLALTTCYIAAFLAPAAMVLALPMAIVILEIPMYIVGLFILPRRTDNLDANSFVLMALMFLASVWMATRPSWARFPAYVFLALCAANAVAAAILFALRRPIAELERRCGA